MNPLQIVCLTIAIVAVIDIWITSINKFHYHNSAKKYIIISNITSFIMCIGWFISFYYQRYFFRLIMGIIYLILLLIRFSILHDENKTRKKFEEQQSIVKIIDVPSSEVKEEDIPLLTTDN